MRFVFCHQKVNKLCPFIANSITFKEIRCVLWWDAIIAHDCLLKHWAHVIKVQSLYLNFGNLVMAQKACCATPKTGEHSRFSSFLHDTAVACKEGSSHHRCLAARRKMTPKLMSTFCPSESPKL